VPVSPLLHPCVVVFLSMSIPGNIAGQGDDSTCW
jgi:hypothetical protein